MMQNNNVSSSSDSSSDSSSEQFQLDEDWTRVLKKVKNLRKGSTLMRRISEPTERRAPRVFREIASAIEDGRDVLIFGLISMRAPKVLAILIDDFYNTDDNTDDNRLQKVSEAYHSITMTKARKDIERGMFCLVKNSMKNENLWAVSISKNFIYTGNEFTRTRLLENIAPFALRKLVDDISNRTLDLENLEARINRAFLGKGEYRENYLNINKRFEFFSSILKEKEQEQE